MDVEKYGPTKGCPGYRKVMRKSVPSCIVATHTVMGTVNALRDSRRKTPSERTQKTEHKRVTMRQSQNTWKSTLEERRSQDTVTTHKRRLIINRHHRRQAVEQSEQTTMCSTSRKAMIVCTSKT